MNFNTPFSQIITKALILSTLMGIASYFLFPLLEASHDHGQLAALMVVIASILTLLLGSLEISFESNDNGGEPVSIFVGNLAYKANRNDIQALFAEYGDVHSVRIMTDRATRRPRGFGFVEMNEKAARKAIKKLDGYEFMGRELKVNEGNQRRNKADD